MTITAEELQRIAETDHVQCGDAAAIASELIAARAALADAAVTLSTGSAEWERQNKELRKAEAELAALAAQKPVAWTDESELKDLDNFKLAYIFSVNPVNPHADARRVIPLFTRAAPAGVVVPDDYFARLVAAARVSADKAMRKFPQPNYVLNKVAEESGEVIKAVIHFTEGREEWVNVEGEIIDNLAMLIRLVTEGDQVIGFTPPAAVIEANGGAK